MRSVAFLTLTVTLACLSAGCASPMTHCIMSVRDAVPAYRLPEEFRACCRSGKVPLDLGLLGLQRPRDGHHIAGGDVLGIYVPGILPPRVEDQAIILPPISMLGPYYPAYGRISSPSTGVPIDVRMSGAVQLPLIGAVNLENQTLEKATDIIRAKYESSQLLKEDRQRVLVQLIRPRVRRVVVMREDAHSPMPQFVPKIAVPYTKIGQGEVIDLPAYENDVLHALAQSGGLPGLDVFSEIWVFRNRSIDKDSPDIVNQMTEAGSPEKLANRWTQQQRQVSRIPLRVDLNEPIPFTEDDITLNDGDVVYLPPREVENYYTGGQLPSGKIPLPRDQDTDVLEAIAYCNGVVGGPNSSAGIFRTGPGNVYPPTDCLIVRKLPNGQLLRIRVDLNRALHDPAERIIIQPEDQIMLFFKPRELYANLLLNYIGFNIEIVPK